MHPEIKAFRDSLISKKRFKKTCNHAEKTKQLNLFEEELCADTEKKHQKGIQKNFSKEHLEAPKETGEIQD